MKRSPEQPTNPPPDAARLQEPGFATALLAWFRSEGRVLPWRSRPDAYSVVVSECMLQQTQVKTVLPHFERWMRRFPDWRTLAGATSGEVLAAWEGLGYYRRATALHRLAQAVVTDHGGILPADPLVLQSLPGLGAYAAGAVASFAFEMPEPAVDANVARVLVRLLDWHAPADAPSTMAALRKIARSIIPDGRAREFNGALMELGALTCIARNPRCVICPVRPYCAARNPEQLPVKKARRNTLDLTEHAVWCVENDRLALVQSGNNGRWHGLWRLPESGSPHGPLIHRTVFPFTHHRITLEVHQSFNPPPGCTWHTRDAIRNLAMPSPHRRVADHLWGIAARTDA